ncbi:MAG: hypothetical protein WCT51_01615 [Candidatus Shapirobacteria bacterium]|jgi:hypothetical protein
MLLKAGRFNIYPLFILVLLFLVFTKQIEATALYSPGETLTPSCLPTNPNCTVTPPVTISTATGSGLTVGSSGVEITDGGITFIKWASNSCINGQIPKFNGTDWVCGDDSGSADLLTWVGSTNVSTLGTITTGVWHGNDVVLGTYTSGNYVAGATGGGGLMMTGNEGGTLALNLGASNVWTGLQTFNNVTINNGLNMTTTSNQLNLGVSGSKTTINANTQTADRIVTIPAMSTNDSFVFNNFGATLTNKTIAAGNNTITGLTTNNLSVGASITNSQLANSSITIETLSGSGLQGGGTVGLGGTLSLSFVSVATPGIYGSATQIPVFQIDQYGSVISVTPTTITGLTNSNLSGSAGINNSQLANNSINVNAVAGTGIGISGSPVALGGTVKIAGLDATNVIKGMASFDAVNFLVINGAVDTIQNIDVLANPTFNGANLTNSLVVTTTTNQLSLGATNTTTISAIAPNASRIATIPGLTIDDTFAFVGQTQTFTNKTIDAGSNTISGLTNSNLSGSAGITDANLATIVTANKVSGSAVQLNTNGGIGDSGGLTLLRTCSDGQLLKWTASGGWACGSDIAGGTPSVYLDGGLLSDGGGLSLIRTCSDGQLLKWTASGGWACDADNSGGGGSLTIEESDQTPSVSSIVELQFGSTGVSSDEFIVSDVGSSAARIRIGNKVVMIDTVQTLTNKTITAIGNTITGLTNSNLSGTAGITDNNLATITTTDKVSGSAIQLSSTGGLENNSGLSLITTCSNSQVLAWNSSTSSWGCGARISILSNITAATAANTINSNDFAQIWNWGLTTDGKTAFTFGENTAATNGTGSQYILGVSTKAGSTANPFKVVAQNNTIFDTTALGAVTIGNIAANQPINIISGDGGINIGNSPNEKIINIGNNTGDTSLNLFVGTSGFSLEGTASSNYSIGSSTTTGTFDIGGVNQTGTANLFASNGGMTVNIGTGNASNIIAIGNSTTSTSIELRSGTGSITAKTGSGNGMQFLSNTVTDDSIKIAPGQNGGATSYQGIITQANLTAGRTWTLPDASGQIPLSTLNNGLFFNTTGPTSLTLPTSGTVTALGNSTTGSGSALVLSTSPTFTTSILTPQIIGSAIADGTITIAGNNALSGNNATGINTKFNVGDSGANTAIVIMNNGFVGIGTTNPVGPFELISQNDFLYVTKYSNDVYSPGVVGRKARGTESAPLAVQTDDKLASLGGRGYDGTTFPLGVLGSSGAFQVIAGENFTATNRGTYLSFIVTPLGSTTRSEKMRLDPAGALNIFNTTNQLSLGTNNTTTISAIAPSTSRIATIPGLTIDDTFAFVGQTQTFTGKTIDGGNNTITGLTNTSLVNSSLTVAVGIGLSGGGTISLGSTGTVALNLGSSNVWTGLQTFNGGISTNTIQASSGNITFAVGGTNSSGKVVIGNSGTTAPDLLVLDNGTSDPTGINGATYYNSSTNKFRCYENSVWKDCDTTGSGGAAKSASIVDNTIDTLGIGETNILQGTAPAITPSSVSNRILITGLIKVTMTSNDTETNTFRVRRGVSGCGGTQVDSDLTLLTTGSHTSDSPVDSYLGFSFIDSPNTTSSQAYTICALTSTATTPNTVPKIMMTIIEVAASGADLAELYSTNDNSMAPGDVVSLDSTLNAGVKKSQKAYDNNVFGVISLRPGVIMGEVDDEGVKSVPVALSGRVPVKVNTENGPIKAGDPLTSSSTPGVAMKATKAGAIIGTAMSDFEGEETGQVLMFIKNGLGTGTKIADLLPGVDENATDFSKQILDELMWQNDNLVLTDLSEIITDRLVAGVEIITPKIVTDKTQTKNLCVGEENNETCITKSQLDQILLKMDIGGTTPTLTPTPTEVGATLDTTGL